jgi:LysM repeat protein
VSDRSINIDSTLKVSPIRQFRQVIVKYHGRLTDRKHMRRIAQLSVSGLLALTSVSAVLVLQPEAAAAAPSPTVEYTVKNGDTLIGISSKLGVTLDELLAANSLTANSRILPGQKLVVPANSPQAQPPAPAVAGSYTVKNGDYLAGIASKNGVKLADLLAVNKMTTTSLIKPGQSLALPVGAAPAAPAAPAAGGVTHTVASGDYLAGIAASYGVKLKDLLAVNKLTSKSIILPGQQLVLPAGATPTPATPQRVVSANAQVTAVVSFAMNQVGKPYKFFTAGPQTYDCSGLTLAAYRQVGITLPHFALYQASYGSPVDWWSQPIKPGDLVFTLSSRHPDRISHVGIAISDSQWVQAPRTGDVVKVSPMPADSNIQAVRRLVG